MKQNKCILVAVTGGIGSGKSTVCEIIRQTGNFTASFDDIYAELLREQAFKDKLVQRFGDILTDGNVDKSKLAEIVFKNEHDLRDLNALTHGEILNRALELTGGKDIAFCEVPLLFEAGMQSKFDEVLVVLRDFEERVQSVMKRSNLTREQVEMRLNNQLNYEKSDFSEYYVIHNTSNFLDLRYEVVTAVKKIKQKYL